MIARGLGLLFASLAVVVVLAGCGGGGSGPVIDSIAPSSAGRGQSIDIAGARFCGDDPANVEADGRCVEPPGGVVNFGVDADAIRASVEMWTDGQITVRVPDSAEVGATVVVVTVNGVASNAANFEVTN